MRLAELRRKGKRGIAPGVNQDRRMFVLNFSSVWAEGVVSRCTAQRHSELKRLRRRQKLWSATTRAGGCG